VKPVGGTRTTQDERDTKYARLPAYMALAYIDGLHLNGIRIVQDEKARAQYERSAVAIHEAKDVTVRGLESTPPKGKLGLPVISLHHVDGALLGDGVALPETGTFVEVSGASRDIAVTGGRLSGAATVKKETKLG
jgi:hypothetical protein